MEEVTYKGRTEARNKADAAGLPLIIAGMMTGKKYWCSSCKNEVVGFKDKPSVREFGVSGMCQSCQDRTFNPLE